MIRYLLPFVVILGTGVFPCPLSGQIRDSLSMERIYDQGVKAKHRQQGDSALYYFEQVRDFALTRNYWNAYFSANKQIGRIWRDLDGRGFETEALLDSLIPLARERLGPDAAGTGELHETLANTYLFLGLYPDAIRQYQESLRIRRLHFGPQSEQVAVSYLNLIRLFTRHGHYEKALIYSELALQLLESQETPSRFLGQAYQLYGRAHLKGPTAEEAEPYLQKALDWVKRHQALQTAQGISIYLDLFSYYLLEKQYKAAETSLSAAREIIEANLPPDHTYFGRLLLLEGQLALEQRDFAGAKRRLQQARSILELEAGHLSLYRSSTVHALGQLAFEEGKYEAALKYFQETILSLCLDFDAVDPLVNPGPEAFTPSRGKLLTAIYNKGLCYYQWGMNQSGANQIRSQQQAHLMLTDAMNHLHQMRTSLQEAEDQLALSENRYRIFELAMANAYRLWEETNDPHWIDEAFQIAERSRANLLRAAWQEGRLSAENPLSVPLRKAEQKLESQLLLARNQWFQEKRKGSSANSSNVADLQKQIGFLHEQRDSLRLQLEQEVPAYYQLKHQVPRTSIARLQQRLESQSQLISYFHTDSVLYLLVLEARETQFIRRKLDSTFSQRLHQWSIGMENPDYLDAVGFEALGFQLYQELFPLPADTAIRELILLPSGPLSALPFALLPTHLSPHPDFARLDYLFRKTEVRYAYAGWTLLQPKTGAAPAPNFWAGFAPSYPAAKQDPLASRQQPVPLPGAEAEVKNIARFLSGDFYTGPAVSKQQFQTLAPDFQVLHLAMHAYTDDIAPLNSGLLFSQTEQADTLLAHEIYTLDLAAELTVLSACNTGRGRTRRGEGVMSLAYAFAYAGCPSVVMSLWPVNDQSSEKLMGGFYEALAGGATKAGALQQAREQYLAQNDLSHPYYWGSFVLIGDNAPLTQNQGSPFWGWMMGLSLLVLLGLIMKATKSNWK